MKKLIVLTAVFCLCFQAAAVLAATPDYSGEWELDVSKSKLPEQARVESMMLKVSQTAKELTIETTVKRSADAGRGGIGGGMRRGGINEAAQTIIYNLDGKESVSDIGSGIMAGSEARTAKVTADGKLSLTMTRKFTSAMGGAATKSNETWELLDGGKTLKIIRYIETPGGGINSEMYFTNKSSNKSAVKSSVQSKASSNENLSGSGTGTLTGSPMILTGKSALKPPLGSVSGGVLNGKALKLIKPSYPKEARASKVGGIVNVSVIIDETGNVIEAQAIQGEPALIDATIEAAKQCKFSPTLVEGKPVKVTGIIIYNFVP